MANRPANRRATARVRRDAGFTLLELMISLALLGVMLAMAYSVFATALASVPRGEDVAARSARMRAATSLLARQVRSIVAYPVEGEEESSPCYFWGDGYSFGFITAAPQHNGGEGLGWVTYWSDGTAFWLAERVIFSASAMSGDAPEAASEIKLLDGLAGARFQYLRLDGSDSEWRDAWDPFEEQTLPGAIRITLDGLGVGNSYWIQEIPLMMVAYGLGTYDCEGGFADRTSEDEDRPDEPGFSPGEGGGGDGGGDEE